jgi:glycosyltransferase involved in cell wall biosynthesis
MNSNAHVSCLVLSSYKITPPITGGQKHTYYFLQALGKIISVHVLGTKNNEVPADFTGQFDQSLPNDIRRYASPLLPFRIYKKLRNTGSKVLIIEHPYMGWAAMLLKCFSRTSYIVHSHNIEAMRFKSTGKWWWRMMYVYEKCTHRFADHNFFITDEDKQYAITHFGLNENRCTTITHGFDFDSTPKCHEKVAAKSSLKQRHNIPAENKILLFNGVLDYPPNRNALDHILHEINPRLKSHPEFKYTMLICGSRLPASYNNLYEENTNHIIYAGFVDDISEYLKGADVFINAVNEGGGIKTKLVEALGFDLNVVTTKNGAIGVPESITGGKMKVIDNNNWSAFANAIIQSAEESYPTPREFYDYFYWNSIATKAAIAINNTLA